MDHAVVDLEQAAATAARATELAIQVAKTTGAEVPAWAGTVVRLLDDWAGQLEGQGGPRAGLAGTGRIPGAWWRAPCGVLEGAGVPAVPLSAHPLATWLRLRFGVRRCLACGQLGFYGSLQPASPLVAPARARTWRCRDQLACRRRRLGRGEPR